MLKLIFGHSKSGKSSQIFNEMKEDALCGTRSFLIVPEQQTVQCEQKLLNLLPSSAQLTSEVLNFSRLSNLVFRHYGGLSYNYADKGCKTLIMWKNLRELAPLLDEYGAAASGNRCLSLSKEMLSAVSELKAYKISPEKLESAADKLDGNDILKKKLLDLSLICAAYSNSLSESFSDSCDDLTKLAEKLREHDFFYGAHIYIDSFTSFTMQEYEVIKEMIRGADRVTVALTLDSISTSHIHYESTADTALRLMSIARDLSSETEQIILSDIPSLPPSLSAICRSLWQPSVKGLNDTDAAERISIIQTKDPYEESEAVANIVKRLMMSGMRCRDISIVARDVSVYRGVLDTALEKAEIPYFFSQATDIMSKPLIKFILSALRIKIYNWRALDIMTFLKSGLCNFDTQSVDLLECYCTVWRIGGASRFCEEFTMNPAGYSGVMTCHGKDTLRKINELRASLVSLLDPLFTRLDSSECAGDMCRAIYLFMEDCAIRDKLSAKADSEYRKGRKREAAELLQLYNATVKALESISVSFGDGECGTDEFADALKVVLESTAVNTIPTAKDQVTVGSASMLRADGIKCAILIGLNEGEFPRNVKEEGLFSNNDKKILDGIGIALSPDTSVRSSEELFYVYRAMTLPTERLILVSHEYDISGATSGPSAALTRIKALFPQLQVQKYGDLPIADRILSPEFATEKLVGQSDGVYSYAMRRFSEKNDTVKRKIFLADIPAENRYCNVAERVSASPLHLTQTLIDNYVGCPFEYMCRRLLSIKEIAPATFDYSSFGTYIHYIFEKYLKRATEDGVIGRPPDPRYISEVVNEYAENYLSETFPGGEASSMRLHFRFARMRRLAELVVRSITREFADSSFRPEFFELSIGRTNVSPSLSPLILHTPLGRSVSLSGKIDRVDLWRKEDGSTYLRVIDYKSGKKKFSLDDVERGENLQLPLYLFALCDDNQKAFSHMAGINGTPIPAGAMYLSSLVPTVDVTEGVNVEEIAESLISRSGFLCGDIDVLSGMSHSLSSEYLCKTKIGKNGIPSGQSLLTAEAMDHLKIRLSDTVTGIGDRIISGDMSCDPSVSDGVRRCERCSMRAVCRAASLFLKRSGQED